MNIKKQDVVYVPDLKEGETIISVPDWVKPIKDVYVLTKDELEQVYNKGFSEGMKEHTHFNGGLPPSQFIKSITQQ